MRGAAVLALVVALALGACSDAADDRADPPTPTTPSTTTEPYTGSLPEPDPAGITFQPVLATAPCDDADATTSLIDGACFTLGPVGFDGTALASAEVVQGGASGGEWVVTVEVADAERDGANATFDACATDAPECPTGQIAVVDDGVVVSVPQVETEGLADEAFLISGSRLGGFERAEAEELAAQLGG